MKCETLLVHAGCTDNPDDGFVPIEEECTKEATHVVHDAGDLYACKDCADRCREEGFKVAKLDS